MIFVLCCALVMVFIATLWPRAQDVDGYRIIVEYASPRTGPGGGRGGARDGERGLRGIGMKRGRDGWDDIRGRRRSPSPRGDRRSPIMRDSWRGGERDREMLGQAEDDYDMRQGHWMHNMPHNPGMNEPPPYWQGGGGGGMPPPGSSGPPRPGRKTLLNTPPVPPIYSGSMEGNQGPPHRSYGGYHAEKGYGESDSYGPPMQGPSRGDHYSGPPPAREGFGAPPPSRGGSGWGAESASGHPPPSELTHTHTPPR